jgi:hypothetical protein
MVWDYSVNRWCRWTDYRLADEGGALAYWSGSAVLTEADQILVEDTEVYTDGGRGYQMVASLGWISPAGPLLWGRLRRWGLDGDALGSFTARVEIDYDFKMGVFTQGYDWAASTLRTGSDASTYDHNPGDFGDQDTWGLGTSWGGNTADGGAFPVNVRFNRQKATSFRMTITDSSETNATLGLRNLTLEFAPNAGLVRIGGRNL